MIIYLMCKYGLSHEIAEAVVVVYLRDNQSNSWIDIDHYLAQWNLTSLKYDLSKKNV